MTNRKKNIVSIILQLVIVVLLLKLFSLFLTSLLFEGSDNLIYYHERHLRFIRNIIIFSSLSIIAIIIYYSLFKKMRTYVFSVLLIILLVSLLFSERWSVRMDDEIDQVNEGAYYSYEEGNWFPILNLYQKFDWYYSDSIADIFEIQTKLKKIGYYKGEISGSPKDIDKIYKAIESFILKHNIEEKASVGGIIDSLFYNIDAYSSKKQINKR